MNRQLLYQAIIQSNMSPTTKSFLGQIIKSGTGRLKPLEVWQGPTEGETPTAFQQYILDQLKGKPNTRSNYNWAREYRLKDSDFSPSDVIDEWDDWQEITREAHSQ